MPVSASRVAGLLAGVSRVARVTAAVATVSAGIAGGVLPAGLFAAQHPGQHLLPHPRPGGCVRLGRPGGVAEDGEQGGHVDQQRVGERRVGQLRHGRLLAGRFGTQRRAAGAVLAELAEGGGGGLVLVAPVVGVELPAGQVDRRVGVFVGEVVGLPVELVPPADTVAGQ